MRPSERIAARCALFTVRCESTAMPSLLTDKSWPAVEKSSDRTIANSSRLREVIA